MKIKIALSTAVSTMSLMLAGGASANNWDAERDMPEISEIVSEYVYAVCDFDIDKINSLRIFDLVSAEEKIMPAADDCKERGGIDRVDVVITPGMEVVYRASGMTRTDTTVYFDDGSSEIVYVSVNWRTPEELVVRSESTW